MARSSLAPCPDPAGVRLNLSKSGLSRTVGGKYAKMTLGKRGTTETTISMPGTGVGLTKHEPPAEPEPERNS
ncbi:MAG: DUF4236 domain-containing protein [Candidatus Limnocylindrales bacterium]